MFKNYSYSVRDILVLKLKLFVSRIVNRGYIYLLKIIFVSLSACHGLFYA